MFSCNNKLLNNNDSVIGVSIEKPEETKKRISVK